MSNSSETLFITYVLMDCKFNIFFLEQSALILGIIWLTKQIDIFFSNNCKCFLSRIYFSKTVKYLHF